MAFFQLLACLCLKHLNNIRKIGLTAGASAPEILVQNFIKFLSKNFKVDLEEPTYTNENVTFKIPHQLKKVV